MLTSSILLSAKRWEYSGMPSESSHSEIVATCFPRSSATEHGTTTMQSNHNCGLWLCDPEWPIGRLAGRGRGQGAGMPAYGVRREKAALSSGGEPHPAKRSSRKQPEQLWR